MASVAFKSLYEAQAVTADVQSDAVSMDAGDVDLIAYALTENSTSSPTYDIDIEHSADGVNWYVLSSLAQISGDGSVIGNITINCLPLVRANVDHGGTGGGDVTVRLYHDRRK